MENEAIQQNVDNSTNDVGDNDDGEPDGDNDDKSLFLRSFAYLYLCFFKTKSTVLRKSLPFRVTWSQSEYNTPKQKCYLFRPLFFRSRMETQVILFLLGHGQQIDECSAEDTMENGLIETDVDIYFARTIIKEASDDVSSILSDLSDYSLWSGLTNKCWNLSIKVCSICDHKHHLMIPLEAHQYTQIEEKGHRK